MVPPCYPLSSCFDGHSVPRPHFYGDGSPRHTLRSPLTHQITSIPDKIYCAPMSPSFLLLRGTLCSLRRRRQHPLLFPALHSPRLFPPPLSPQPRLCVGIVAVAVPAVAVVAAPPFARLRAPQAFRSPRLRRAALRARLRSTAAATTARRCCGALRTAGLEGAAAIRTARHRNNSSGRLNIGSNRRSAAPRRCASRKEKAIVGAEE